LKRGTKGTKGKNIREEREGETRGGGMKGRGTRESGEREDTFLG
jgi:hypothetical protein